MSCLPEDLTGYTALIDSCVLTITDPNSKLKFLFHLGDTTVIERTDGNVLIKDTDGSVVSLSDAQMTSLGLTVAALVIAIKACQGGGSGGSSTAYSDGSAIVGTDPTDSSIQFVVEVNYSESSGNYTYQKTDGTPVVEGVDFVVTSAATSPVGDIKTICKCDDTLNDQTVIVTYVEAYFQTYENGVVTNTPIGNFTDETLSTAYTVIGTAIDCDTLGVNAKGKYGFTTIESGTWSPSALTESFTLRVRAQTGTVTFLDSFGLTTTLDNGEVVSWTKPTNVEFSDATPVLTAGVGESVRVTYTNIG